MRTLRRLVLRTLLPLLSLATSLALPPVSSARTWRIHVDRTGDAPTVQAGIDSAAVGDTVLAGPGTYRERINFLGKDIVAVSEMGPEATVLDGGGISTYTVRFESGETRAAMLEGFTVTGGQKGVSIRAAAPTIRDSIIRGNGDLDGAGIWCTQGTIDGGPWSPLIEGNVIRGNRSLHGIGGGIGVFGGMIPEIVDNLIEDNYTIGDGGGIFWLGHHDGGAIRGNVIRGNRAGDHGGGIVVGSNTTDPVYVEIVGNLIVNNVAEGREDPFACGGGIFLYRSDAWVHQNTVVMNSGGGLKGGLGGALASEWPGSARIERNILAFSKSGGGISCVLGATPMLVDNLTWQNVGGEGVDECPDWWRAGGNVVADPLFCNVGAGDYTVAESSPALSHPAGPVGAYAEAGCEEVPVQATSWGRIKRSRE